MFGFIWFGLVHVGKWSRICSSLSLNWIQVLKEASPVQSVSCNSSLLPFLLHCSGRSLPRWSSGHGSLRFTWSLDPRHQNHTSKSWGWGNTVWINEWAHHTANNLLGLTWVTGRSLKPGETHSVNTSGSHDVGCYL